MPRALLIADSTALVISITIQLFIRPKFFIFSVTGLFILKTHAAHRPGTWPLVGLGVLVPLLLALLFIH